MKLRDRNKRTLYAALLLAALCGALAGPAAGATIGFDPDTQTVTLGAASNVDVVFSDLADEIISAYDLDVTYDATVLDATGVLFTTALGDELFFEAFNDFDLSTPGIVDLAQLSLLSDAALAVGQPGDVVVVATLLFDTIAAGTTQLDFVFDALNDVKGRNAAVLPLVVDSASITVTDPGPSTAPIPEPSAAVLFALGAALVLPMLRREV